MKLLQSERKLLWVSLFGMAFALVESSVVVYLRSLYYPEGFTFPLKLMSPQHLGVELSREAATIVMLSAVGVIAGSKAWERFAYFLVAFGVWDIFYYVWLKVMLDWPASLNDWDILFLIPLPWIGPAIAPVLISLLMIVCGSIIIARLAKEEAFHPGWMSWSLSAVGALVVLYSFMEDTSATLHGQQPAPYKYSLLVVFLILNLISFVLACGYSSPFRKIQRG
jgi:bacteriorhodopsin